METETEYQVIIEGVKYGRPFRETNRARGAADATRQLTEARERIANPPREGLTGYQPTILRAELRTRTVTPWTIEDETGRRPIVDTWLAGARHKLHDMDDVTELEGRESA